MLAEDAIRAVTQGWQKKQSAEEGPEAATRGASRGLRQGECDLRLDMPADLQLNSRLGCQAVIAKPGKQRFIPFLGRNCRGKIPIGSS